MDILEKLKQKADHKRKDIEQASNGAISIGVVRSIHVVNGLQQIHAYLHEFIEQLNFIDSDITTSMQADGLGTMENLRQGDYKLITESTYRKENIVLLFSLNNDDVLTVEAEDNSELKEKLDTLKDGGLLANYESRNPCVISIQGYVPVRIEFYSDFEEMNVHVVIRNFRRLANEHYLLGSDSINDKFLDQLGKFILREENKFMDMLTEDSHGISIAQRTSELLNAHGDTQTSEMDISRLRSLFNREHRLYLTYHNNIMDIGTRSQGFIVGRAKDCELVVQSDMASRHHAQLIYRKGKFVLIDQSTNGTFVKPQGGQEVYVQSEALPLSGSGFISLGKAVTVDNEHLIYYSCQ